MDWKNLTNEVTEEPIIKMPDQIQLKILASLHQ
jgi:hypothetical protein